MSQSGEDDFVWLLSTLKSGAKDFETLYGVGFVISDTVIIKQGEPKTWLYSDPRGMIRSRDEEWMKLQVVKEYLKNPSIQQDDLHDIENMNEVPQISNLNTQTQQSGNTASAGNTLGNFKRFAKGAVKAPPDSLFYFFQSHKGKTIVRTANASSADILLSKPQDYVEFLNNWSKIIAYAPVNRYKGSVLYQVVYNGKNKKCQISRKNIESKTLDPVEFVKKEGQQKKTFEFEAKVFKSLAAGVNEKCNHFVLSLVRYIENKFHREIRDLSVDFFMNDSGTIYLSGADRILFNGPDGEAELLLDKTSLTPYINEKVEAFKCKGQYCDCAHDPTYYDENDEAFCLFIQPESSDKEYHVQYKSIFMDQIERVKTIQAIKAVDKTVRLTEQLIFRCRKFYSFSKMTASKMFAHMKFDNVYKQIRVCQYCHQMYMKLDDLRVEFQGQRKRKQVTPEDIRATIVRMVGTNGTIIGGNLLKEKHQISSQLQEKLLQFDMEVDDFNRDYIVTKSTDPAFFSTSKKRKALHASHALLGIMTSSNSANQRFLGAAGPAAAGTTRAKTSQNFFAMTQSASTTSAAGGTSSAQRYSDFALPQIVELRQYEKDKSKAIGLPLKKRQVSKADAEALGLKHYLGHTKNLPFSDCGLAISKSSLALNHLQDKINEVQQLKAKMESNRIKKEIEDISILMCPYYGNGKVDETRLNEFIQSVRERRLEENQDAEYSQQQQQFQQNKNNSNAVKKVQIVTDKNEFLTDAQRKLKQEREKKAREIEENKKNFLEENRELAASVLKMGQEERRAKHDRRRRDMSMKATMYSTSSQNRTHSNIYQNQQQQSQQHSQQQQQQQQHPLKTKSSMSDVHQQKQTSIDDIPSSAAEAAAARRGKQNIDQSDESNNNSDIQDNSMSESRIEDNPSLYKPTDFSLLQQDN